MSTCPSYNPALANALPLEAIRHAGGLNLSFRVLDPIEKPASGRYVGPCMKYSCSNWVDSGCAIARFISTVQTENKPATSVIDCEIRPSCRWFSQEGPSACAMCPYVREDSFTRPG